MKTVDEIKKKIAELESQKDQLFRMTAVRSDKSLLSDASTAATLVQQKIDLLNWVLKK